MKECFQPMPEIEETLGQKEIGTQPPVEQTRFQEILSRRMSRRDALKAFAVAAASIGFTACGEPEDETPTPRSNSQSVRIEVPPKSTAKSGVEVEVILKPIGASTPVSEVAPQQVDVVDPTATYTATPEPTFTATSEPTATTTPTEVPPTPTPENTPTPEVQKDFVFSFGLDQEITIGGNPEDDPFPIPELIPNPAYINDQGLNAEQAVQKLIPKAHMRAWYIFKNGDTPRTKLNDLDTQEYIDIMQNGNPEDAMYELYARPKDQWDSNEPPTLMKVDPTKGLKFAWVTKEEFRYNVNPNRVGNIRDDGTEYFHIVDSDGLLTCVYVAPKNPSAESLAEKGLYNPSWSLVNGAELMSEVAKRAGGEYAYIQGKEDPDIAGCTDVEAPSDSIPDGNTVVYFPKENTYRYPLFVKHL